MEYRILPAKGQLIEIKLYKEECEDILRAVKYYRRNFDIKSLDKKPDDKYEAWYGILEDQFYHLVNNINEWRYY